MSQQDYINSQKTTSGISLTYVLRLKCHKFYIGYTKNLNDRISCFLLRGKSTPYWIREYPFDSIVSVDIGDVNDMRKLFLEYVSIHGIDNVRCSEFTKVNFEEFDIPHWVKMS